MAWIKENPQGACGVFWEGPTCEMILIPGAKSFSPTVAHALLERVQEGMAPTQSLRVRPALDDSRAVRWFRDQGFQLETIQTDPSGQPARLVLSKSFPPQPFKKG